MSDKKITAFSSKKRGVRTCAACCRGGITSAVARFIARHQRFVRHFIWLDRSYSVQYIYLCSGGPEVSVPFAERAKTDVLPGHGPEIHLLRTRNRCSATRQNCRAVVKVA